MPDNIVVYTANFGGKDNLVEIKHIEPGVRYVYFTDTEVISSTWEVVIVEPKHDPRKEARWYKTHSHELFPDAIYTVWKDARITLKHPIRFYINELNRKPVCFTKHPVRNCVYKEALTCIDFKLDNKKKRC